MARKAAAEIGHIEMEITIEASPESVWTSIVEGIDEWWLPDFHMVPESRMMLDARPGGHLIETNDLGSGLLWFTVVHVEPRATLHMQGSVCPPWGGPAVTFLRIVLEENDSGATIVKVSDHSLGHTDRESRECTADGWKQLFGRGLKKYAESR